MQIHIPQNRSKMILRFTILIAMFAGIAWLFWFGPLADKHELKAEFVRYSIPPLLLWIVIWGGWVIATKMPIIKADQNGIWVHSLFKEPRQVPWSGFTQVTFAERQRNTFLEIHFKDDTRALYNLDRLLDQPYVFMVSHRNVDGGVEGLQALAAQIAALPEAKHLFTDQA